ncbi:unnamed protein product [Linum tenue]|uniref:Uncharacterized protein n=1 Tax=Linum tenue TaxID=586396 RepID=A0AAV0Q168_9ROSI|nr:unnamed protein product [Linum tenue]
MHFTSVFFLSIVMIFSSIRHINNGSIYQYVWSWTINNDFSLEIKHISAAITISRL